MDTYMSSLGSRGDWREYDAECVKAHIRELAGEPDLEKACTGVDATSETFEFAKSEIISIIQSELEERDDGFLENLKKEIEKLDPLSAFGVAQHLSPNGQTITRDTVVLGQGKQIPPHMSLIAEVQTIRHNFGICRAVGEKDERRT